jgi:hypothetical protein
MASGTLNGVPWCLLYLLLLHQKNGVFVRFTTRGVQKRHKNLSGGSPCQKLLAKKAEGERDFSCRISPSIFFNRVFGRFSA